MNRWKSVLRCAHSSWKFPEGWWELLIFYHDLRWDNAFIITFLKTRMPA
jgi:hypothetical protein